MAASTELRHKVRGTGVLGALAAWCLLGLAVAGPAGADVLVTNSGSRYEGQVRREGGTYVVRREDGGEMSIPASMVKQVIRTEQAIVEFESMVRDADLAKDADVARLAAAAKERGLDAQFEGILGRAFKLRRSRAGKDPQALRRLAEWCGKYELGAEAGTCVREAAGVEFPARLAAAGEDLKRLEELAAWCRRAGLTDGVEASLRREHEHRAMAAATAHAWWDLASWSAGWGVGKWRDGAQLRAIESALSAGDLPSLTQFSQALEADKTVSPPVRRKGLEAWFTVRLKLAAADPVALAELAEWAGEVGLKEQGARAEAEAVRLAPDNPHVRQLLAYVKDARTGAWVKCPTHWLLEAVGARFAESHKHDHGEGALTITPKEGFALLLVSLRLTAVVPDRQAVDKLAAKRRALFPTAKAGASILMSDEERKELKGRYRMFDMDGLSLKTADGKRYPPIFPASFGPGELGRAGFLIHLFTEGQWSRDYCGGMLLAAQQGGNPRGWEVDWFTLTGLISVDPTPWGATIVFGVPQGTKVDTLRLEFEDVSAPLPARPLTPE